MYCYFIWQTVTTIVRNVTFHKISTEQLKVLLVYAEADIMDHTRHATAFSLIKAIIHRRLICDEMHSVISHIEQLAVSSQNPAVRVQCRQVRKPFVHFTAHLTQPCY